MINLDKTIAPESQPDTETNPNDNTLTHEQLVERVSDIEQYFSGMSILIALIVTILICQFVMPYAEKSWINDASHNPPSMYNSQAELTHIYTKSENKGDLTTLMKILGSDSEISSLAAEVRKDQNQDCMSYLETLKGYAQDDLTIAECRFRGRIFMDAVRGSNAMHAAKAVNK